MMQIFVKGRATIDAEPGCTVGTIKAKVHAKTGILVEQQRLIFADKELADERTLVDYNITNNATLHLLLRLPGGDGQQVLPRTCVPEAYDCWGAC